MELYFSDRADHKRGTRCLHSTNSEGHHRTIQIRVKNQSIEDVVTLEVDVYTILPSILRISCNIVCKNHSHIAERV